MENQGRREQQEKESKFIMVYCLLGTALVLTVHYFITLFF